MRKRASSHRIDHLAKRQRSHATLIPEAGADQGGGEALPTTSDLSHTGQRTSDARADRDVIQQGDETCSLTQSETTHPTTPVGSSFFPSEKVSLDMEVIERGLQKMKVRDGDHSVSDFTSYHPGQMNTEDRYARKFVAPPYGRNEHRYHLPMDEEEELRSEIGHRCWMYTTKLLYVRIESGIILDLGTGDGRWVQDVANMKPSCTVIGVDQYYSDKFDTPNQAEFEVDDCELDFVDREEPVTLVNLRDSFLWVRDHQMLTKRIYKILGPDGWFQNQEIRLFAWDCNKPQVRRWRDAVLASARKLGIQLYSATEMARAMAQAGFVEYQSESVTWTIEKLPELREYALLTVKASVGILYDAWGESADLKGVVHATIGELEAHDCHIQIGVDVCWAKKSARRQRVAIPCNN